MSEPLMRQSRPACYCDEFCWVDRGPVSIELAAKREAAEELLQWLDTSENCGGFRSDPVTVEVRDVSKPDTVFRFRVHAEIRFVVKDLRGDTEKIQGGHG